MICDNTSSYVKILRIFSISDKNISLSVNEYFPKTSASFFNSSISISLGLLLSSSNTSSCSSLPLLSLPDEILFYFPILGNPDEYDFAYLSLAVVFLLSFSSSFSICFLMKSSISSEYSPLPSSYATIF